MVSSKSHRPYELVISKNEVTKLLSGKAVFIVFDINEKLKQKNIAETRIYRFYFDQFIQNSLFQ